MPPGETQPTSRPNPLDLRILQKCFKYIGIRTKPHVDHVPEGPQQMLAAAMPHPPLGIPLSPRIAYNATT